MATINIKINGLTGFDTQVMEVGMPPIVIFWDHDFVQQQYQLRIRNDNTNWGSTSFNGNILEESQYSSTNTYIYTLKNLERNVLYYCQIRIKDDSGDWTIWQQFRFKTNRLPTVTGYNLTPTSPSSIEDVELSYTFIDLDNHDESGTQIRWFKNNLLQSTYNNLFVLPSSATSPNDSWTAKVTPSDGIEFGPTVETVAVTISSPDISADNITILPINPNVDDILKVEYDLQAEEDYIPVTLTGAISFEWYINGIAVPNSNSQYIRLDLSPLDIVHVVLTVTEGASVLLQQQSADYVIQDVQWYVYDLLIDDLVEAKSLTDLNPLITWKVHKTTVDLNERPDLYRVLVTKTLSRNCTVYDTGDLEYTKDSYLIPTGILEYGKDYYIHVGVKEQDSEYADPYIPNLPVYASKRIHISGSSWLNNASNGSGWTVETRAKLDDANQKLGMYIHDGTYFCSVTFSNRQITFHSDESVSYTIPASSPDFTGFRNLKISAKNQNVKIFIDSDIVIDAIGALTNKSQLKIIEYGDIDGKNINKGTFAFVRYSTDGAYNFGDSLTNENTFCFHTAGDMNDGSVDYVKGSLVAWKPSAATESSKIMQFTESGEENTFPAVAKNNSPITAMYVDNDRNKYIGTANGINGIFGEKHDPNYELSTANLTTLPSIASNNFDLVSTVTDAQLPFVEPRIKDEWLTIDTTYDAVANPPVDEYGNISEYIVPSHAIHYYTQRVPGHSWFDNVDNAKGWQTTFSFKLDELEQDQFQEENLARDGVGVYINDGTYQEILYFYYDRIRLFYANVYVSLPMTISRDYRVVVKEQNILIYQKINGAPISTYAVAVDGTGLFNTPSSPAANSRKPKVSLDSAGFYHAVWHDDGSRRSQILYSMFDGASWSVPEIITESVRFSLRNPSIDVDSQDRLWIAYEDTSFGDVEIIVSVKDSIGWNSKVRVTNSASVKAHPSIRVDSIDDVYLVWEDNRNGPSEIYAAHWHDSGQYWTSSGQFGDDEAVMVYNQDDPYQANQSVSFKNPQLALDYPKMWLVCEAHLRDNSQKDFSVIYRGWRDLENGFWWGSGNPAVTNGNIVGFYEPFLCSSVNRQCVNPSVSASEIKGALIVTWEDQTEPIYQIWGSIYNVSNIELQEPQKLTDQTTSCTNPSVGWVNNEGVIAFEYNDDIYVNFVLGINLTFSGSATGGEDRRLFIEGKVPRNPSMPPVSQSRTFRSLYDYPNETTNEYSDRLKELPEFYLIGDVTATHESIAPTFATTVTTIVGDGVVSSLDTKEFAFGDFSENIGINSHWKDFQMYFGYDARPHSISTINSSSVINWPDDRINDLFADVYGNIIAATFGGLVYFNTSTGESTLVTGSSVIDSTIVTAVKWGGNGIWYVGSTEGGVYSNNAGENWNEFSELSGKTVNCITVSPQGEGIYGTTDGVYIVKPGQDTVSITSSTGLPYSGVRSIAVDDNNIIWAGTDYGLIRIEDYSNFVVFDSKSGMKSGHINDIAIVNTNLRYLATASGVERMYGTQFSNLQVVNKNLINDNISRLQWVGETNSLWISSLGAVYEVVFRDPAHEIIQDESVAYSTSELVSDDDSDRYNYFILNYNYLQNDPENPSELGYSNTVTINKNPVYFGYIIDSFGQSVRFLTEILKRDQIELITSTKVLQFHDFNQTSIEQSVKGTKIAQIIKIDNTSQNQQLFLSDLDKNELLLYGGETNLPFTTIMLDRELPKGCLQQVDTLTKTTLKFKIIAEDRFSGIDGYILSNYENFTSNGSTALSYTPLTNNIVTHDIGNQITNVADSLTFPETDTIDATTYTIGTGSALGKIMDTEGNIEYLVSGTSSPAMLYRYDPTIEEWDLVSSLDDADDNRQIHKIYTANNVMFVITGSDTGGSLGRVYKSNDGSTFELISGSITGQHIYGATSTSDGSVYFGSSDGRVYLYNSESNSLQLKYQNIGSTIYALSVFSNTLIAATGDTGRVYVIDLTTDNNLIVYDGTDTYMSEAHVKDADVASDPKDSSLYIASGSNTVIYRSDLEDYDFIKSYSSLGQTVGRIKDIAVSTLAERTTTEGAPSTGETNAVASIGSSLYKHINPSWEFFYRHDEEINDFIPYTTSGVEGVFIISDSKVTKWTNILAQKTVYLKLRDKAGNESADPDTSVTCPSASTSICCSGAYSINVSDLKDFVNENRIVDIDEYGVIQFSYDSPNNNTFYSADKIDQEVGVYTSETLNGSANLVSWRSLTWVSDEPAGTSIVFQIRSGISEDDVLDATWSDDLTKNVEGFVNIEYVTNQYIQFRAILTTDARGTSPSLSSVTLRSITTQATHFFTTNFILPSRPIKGLMTANIFLPVSSDVVFGISTKNSVDFADYQVIEANRLFTTDDKQFGENIRIGAKLISPATVPIPDEYNSSDAHNCTVSIDFTNTDASAAFHFRVRFYSDFTRTQEAYSFFSGNDQYGWTYDNAAFPALGLIIPSGATRTVEFNAFDQVTTNTRLYLVIDAYNDTTETYETVADNESYSCLSCSVQYEPGLTTEYYKTGLPSGLTQIPDFGGYVPDYILVESDIDFNILHNTDWIRSNGQALPGFDSDYAIRFLGRIYAPEEGIYQFNTTSANGSQLYIQNNLVIDHDGDHGFTSKTGSIELTQGYHSIVVLYFQGDGTNIGLELRWTTPSVSEAIVPNNYYFYTTPDPYCAAEDSPLIYNLACVFETESGETIKINLNN